MHKFCDHSLIDDRAGFLKRRDRMRNGVRRAGGRVDQKQTV
jgi:hypothetical protein